MPWFVLIGGDLSPKNVWLAETVLDIFTENRYLLRLQLAVNYN